MGYTFNKAVRSFFGLGKPTMRRWVDIFVVPDMDTIVSYFRQYFDGQHETLLARLYKEDQFDAMEAYA